MNTILDSILTALSIFGLSVIAVAIIVALGIYGATAKKIWADAAAQGVTVGSLGALAFSLLMLDGTGFFLLLGEATVGPFHASTLGVSIGCLAYALQLLVNETPKLVLAHQHSKNN